MKTRTIIGYVRAISLGIVVASAIYLVGSQVIRNWDTLSIERQIAAVACAVFVALLAILRWVLRWFASEFHRQFQQRLDDRRFIVEVIRSEIRAALDHDRRRS